MPLLSSIVAKTGFTIAFTFAFVSSASVVLDTVPVRFAALQPFLPPFCPPSHVRGVGGSFSARVPRSSAEVHREFVHHILEDEVDGQKEGQGDQREAGEEEVNGVVEEREIRHNNQMTHAWME